MLQEFHASDYSGNEGTLHALVDVSCRPGKNASESSNLAMAAAIRIACKTLFFRRYMSLRCASPVLRAALARLQEGHGSWGLMLSRAMAL